jgi:hypothetical protein
VDFYSGLDKVLGECKAKIVRVGVDESRKRVLLIAASILAARKLSQYEEGDVGR